MAVGHLTLIAPARTSATPVRGIEAVIVNRESLASNDYVVRDITIAPGGSTGWHWHDGELAGVIKQGTLTHNASNCSVDGIYHVGDAIIEPAGADHIHIGRNLGLVPVILEVIYIQPSGAPAAEDAPNPGCDFA
jgi:quercetin dioxygenase-like cupin family protein